MTGFGIGLSWGVTSAEIDTSRVFPVIKTRDWYAEGKITPQMLM
jgi:3-oxoacyl-[acyl-carrier-protein] synthase-3